MPELYRKNTVPFVFYLITLINHILYYYRSPEDNPAF